MISWLKWLCIGLISLLLVIFIAMNRQPITLSLFPLPYELVLPTYLFITLFFLSGYLVAWLLGSIRHFRDIQRLRQAERRVAALENETEGLKLKAQESTLLLRR